MTDGADTEVGQGVFLYWSLRRVSANNTSTSQLSWLCARMLRGHNLRALPSRIPSGSLGLFSDFQKRATHSYLTGLLLGSNIPGPPRVNLDRHGLIAAKCLYSMKTPSSSSTVSRTARRTLILNGAILRWAFAVEMRKSGRCPPLTVGFPDSKTNAHVEGIWRSGCAKPD